MAEVRGGVHRLLALLIVGVAVLSAASGVGAAARPNIVFVLTDDQRFDTLGTMPTVQRELVGRGVTFTNAFVVNALCCPSRASILTGRYSHSTNVYGNSGQYGGFGSFRDRSTVGTWLRSAGYRTGYVGKYLNGYGRSYVPPGWDRWVAFTRVGYERYELNVDGSRRRYRPGNPAHYSTDVLTRHATRFIRNARKPFLLIYAPFAPHSPAVAALRHADAFADTAPWRPPNYNEQDVSDKPTWIRQIPPWSHDDELSADLFRRHQLQTLLAVDDGVKALLAELRRRRILRDTIVVFMSDNGYSWGAHRIEGKGVPYDESIRVPLVIRYDRLFRGSRIETRTALNIDLAPTFAAAARAKPARVDGQSLLGIVGGSAAPGRDDFLVEHLRGAPYPAMPTYCGIRSSTWKYIFYGTGEDELYDLTADPYELKSRAADPAYRSQVVAMRARLDTLCTPTPPDFSRSWLCMVAAGPLGGPLTGTNLADFICGGPGADSVAALDGNDAVLAGAGNDTVDGGAGDDELRGGSGSDSIFGGSGDDRIFAQDLLPDQLECGQGYDIVVADPVDTVAVDCELRLARRP
jgi:N-acetylglucosamine-6-sulfatase